MCSKNRVSSDQGILHLIDNTDRAGDSCSDGLYSGTHTYAHSFENQPGKRVPKAGVVAEAGVGRAGAEWSVFSAEAKGPNASASAEANISEAGAMAQAELGSVSASAGPVTAKLGLGIETGVKVSPSKVDFKLLGTGLTLGSTIGLSLFGSELTFKLW